MRSMGAMRTGPRQRAALVACLIFLAAGCGGDRGPGSSDRPSPGTPNSVPPASGPGSPDRPATSTPRPGSPNAHPGEPSPTPSPVRPRPGTTDPRPVKYTSATPGRDGRALEITWWSGVEPCHVLDRVDVAYRPDAVVVTVFEGRDPARGNEPCIEIAVRKKTVVSLGTPLDDRKVIDGAGR
jgi:hypothetical protein